MLCCFVSTLATYLDYFILQLNEEVYPEAYRKSDYIKGSNDDIPETFRIARIQRIYTSLSSSGIPALDKIKLKVQKFYR